MTGFTKSQKAEVLARDDGVCLMWGTNPFCAYYADTVNHRINRGSGGSKGLNVTVNACAICSMCNGLIEADRHLSSVARLRGVKVRSSHNLQRDIETLIGTALHHPTIGVYYLDAAGTRVRDVEGK
jgi:hypothetical protein